MRSRIWAGFLLSLMILGVVVALFVSNKSRLLNDATRVDHSQKVISALDNLLIAIDDIETAQRGFALTGEDAFLEPYTNAVGTIDYRIDDIQNLVADNPVQAERVALLREYVKVKIGFVERAIQVRRDNGLNSVVDLTLSNQGKVAMDSIRRAIRQMQDTENALLQERADSTAHSNAWTDLLAMLLIALGIGFLVSTFIALETSLRERNRAETTVHFANARLESRVQQRTGELAAANAALRLEVIERQDAQEAERLHRERLQTTLTSIGDGVIVTDENGRVTILNDTAELLTGWQHHEAAGQHIHNIFRIINQETRLPVDNPVDKVFEHGYIVGLANHTVLISRNGEERPIDDSGAPIRDDEGRIIGAVLVFRDISERYKMLESERQARLTAENAIRERDAFLSVAAHELKTPITSMRGFSQMLSRMLERKTPISEELLKKAIQNVERQSIKLSHLLAQLLDLSRFEAGRLLLDRKWFNLVQLVNETVEMIQSETGKHTLVIVCPDSCPVYADQLRIEQVLVNLLNNAVKYSPDGGDIEITVKIADETHLDLCVRDHGLGIPLERRDNLFERFYQAHGQGYLGGMGLGLYISAQIIHLHQGSISADFPDDGGTRFNIRLPIGEPVIVSG